MLRNRVIIFSSFLILLSCNDSIEENQEMKHDEEIRHISFNNKKLDIFPEEIFQHKYLEKIYLNNNKITEIPARLSELKYLKELHLNRNYITNIPKAITELKNLELLDLLFNNVDTVATEICELPKLRYLNLNGNPNGSIPSCLINSNKIVFYYESTQVKPKSKYYPKSGDKFDFSVFKSVPATKENSK